MRGGRMNLESKTSNVIPCMEVVSVDCSLLVS